MKCRYVIQNLIVKLYLRNFDQTYLLRNMRKAQHWITSWCKNHSGW